MANPEPAAGVPVKVEFSGGLEILFSMQRSMKLIVPAPSGTKPATVASLIDHLTSVEEFDASRKDLFVLDGTVRPGILVLINDADWELEGEADYQLQAGDVVVFVSTLHGG